MKKLKTNKNILVAINCILASILIIVVIAGARNYKNKSENVPIKATNKAKEADIKNTDDSKQILISFVDDDGTKEVINKWKPILDAEKVNISFAIITNKVGANHYLSLSDLKEIYNNGNDILSHTVSHPHLDTISDVNLEKEFKDSQQWFVTNGFVNSTNTIVYPYGEFDDNQKTRILNMSSKYYSYGINAGGDINTLPLQNKMYLSRINANTNDLNKLKSKVDQVSQSGGWLIFLTHSEVADFNSDTIKGLIDYIKSKNLTIMKISDVIPKLK